MLIDSHQHVFWLNKNDREIVREMDELGIDQAWLLTWYLPPGENNPGYHVGTNPLHIRPDGTHAGMPLSDVLAARDRFPDRFVAGYCPCPLEGNAAAAFESAYHMHGVRVCGEWSYRMLLDDPRAIELFRAAGRLKCPVVLHMDVPYLPDAAGNSVYQPFWHAGTVDNLERALRACPDTIFIGHAPGFWREISADATTQSAIRPSGPVLPGGRIQKLLDTFPNLHADLSAGSGLNALMRDPAHARQFILRNADRLLYGRDNIGHDLFRFLQTLDLPPDVRKKLYSVNALKLVPA